MTQYRLHECPHRNWSVIKIYTVIGHNMSRCDHSHKTKRNYCATYWIYRKRFGIFEIVHICIYSLRFQEFRYFYRKFLICKYLNKYLIVRQATIFYRCLLHAVCLYHQFSRYCMLISRTQCRTLCLLLPE